MSDTAKKHQLKESTQHQISEGYEKRRAYHNLLKKFNEYYKVLIDILYRILFNQKCNIDNRPVSEFQKKVKDAATNEVRTIAQNLCFDSQKVNTEKYLFLNSRFIKYVRNVFDKLKTLVSFLYKNRFRSAERTKKAIQWYWDELKKDTSDMISDVVDYMSEQIRELQESKQAEPCKAEFEAEIFTQVELNIEQTSNLEQEVEHTGCAQQESTPEKESHYEITGVESDGGLKTKYRNNIEAIKLLKALEHERRSATAQEKTILAKFIGWGCLPQVFSKTGAAEWEAEKQELKDILTESEYIQSKANTLNGHYTSNDVIKFMYEVLGQLGFNGGSVLEPAMGIGNFMGAFPKGWLSNSNLFGIELDTITGRIAKQLYPGADIRVMGYQDCIIPDCSFDIAVSNVPFGAYRVNDKRYNHMNLSIHDYFFAKSLDVVRPGGIIAFITSMFTMDKKDSTFRKYISDKANLIGAVRLPNTAFKKNAGTEVTTDIIFLQKKVDSNDTNGITWVSTGSDNNGIDINEYYLTHPYMLMGELTIWKRMYGSENTTLMPTGDLVEMLSQTVKNFPQGAYQPIPQQNSSNLEEILQADETLPADPNVKEYGYFINNGGIYQREGYLMQLVDVKGKRLDRLKGMIEIRDALKEVIAAQMQDTPDMYITEAQTTLNTKYDEFVKDNGYLNDKVNKDLFLEDPEHSLILALENMKGGQVLKADIFSRRTINPSQKVYQVGNCEEALSVSLNETGSVNLQMMATLTGKNENEVIMELQGRIYFNPHSKKWETAEEYLSGNIALKLQIAQLFVENDPNGNQYQHNVTALQNALPEKLKSEDIVVKLGASWIPEEDIRDFLGYILDIKVSTFYQPVKVKYSKNIATWTIESNLGYCVANTKTWGTDRMTAVKIVEHTLNMTQVSIYDKDSDGKQILNKKETVAARAKQDAIKEEYGKWIFEDQDRRRRLTELYNEKFNNIVLRTYNGDYLTLPAMNSSIQLNKHQKDAVARILNGGNSLLAHAVGAGKTFECIAAAMEMKRIGLIKKPMFVVPNSLTEQWGREFNKLYPNANVLVCTKKDFEKENRQRLISRIVTGDWDGIIIAHSQFTKIPVSNDLLSEMIRGQIQELEESIEGIEQANTSRAGTRLVKRLEKMKANLCEQLEEFYESSKKDNVVNFEQLGVDQLFVDEADEFKNLGIFTKIQNVAGINTTRSQKAFDLYVKVQYLSRLRDGKGGVVFATGTPITNSMSEMYIVQKFLAPETLKEKGILHFDAWASTFAEVTASMEITPDGTGYRTKQRFSKFNNLVELLTMFRDFTDVQTKEMLNLPVPKLKTGKPIIVSAEPSIDLQNYVQELVKRSEAIRANAVDPKDDNMLMVTNDGRRAALDLRLIDSAYPDYPDSKVNKAVENVYSIWKDTEQERLTQLIFCDLSTPGSGRFDVYNDIKTKLVNKGIPADEIAFIHDADTENKKTVLFDKVRAGIVRILMGSTSKMGAGMNVQDRICSLTHLDAPWRPRDIEQREGRILRQGNLNSEVTIFRHVTKGSFDAYLWQILENKAKFIGQVMNGKASARMAEDLDSGALSYAEVKAIASGNPLVLEKLEVDSELQRLHSLKSSYLSNRYRMQDELLHCEKTIGNSEKQISGYVRDMNTCLDVAGDKFTIEVNGGTYTDRKDAGQSILIAAHQFKTTVKEAGAEQRSHIGSFAGFDLYVSFKKNFFVDDAFNVVIKGEEEYHAEVSASPAGMISRIENAVSSIKNKKLEREELVIRINKQIKALEAELAKPFDKEEQLRTLVARQQELNMLLDRGKATELLDASETETA